MAEAAAGPEEDPEAPTAEILSLGNTVREAESSGGGGCSIVSSYCL